MKRGGWRHGRGQTCGWRRDDGSMEGLVGLVGLVETEILIARVKEKGKK